MLYEITDEMRNRIFKYLSRATLVGEEAPDFMKVIEVLNTPVVEKPPEKEKK